MPAPRRLALPAPGPEDVVLDLDGRLLTGLSDGRVVRIDPATGAVTTLARTGGRPLGLHACTDGTVLVCDAERGLLRIDTDGGLEVLVASVDGVALNFASNVVEDGAGTVYFSASSRRFDLAHFRGDLLEHSGTGRLFRRDPDGHVETLLDGLHFANGVVLAPDRSCLLVAETGAYRITRYRLTGPDAGSHDVLVDNLPGFPDNMALGSDGLAWVALASARDRTLDRLLPLPGALRAAAWLLPHRWQPQPVRTAWVLGIDLDGRIVHDLQRSDDYHFVTSVYEDGGTLYLGSLVEDSVAVLPVP